MLENFNDKKLLTQIHCKKKTIHIFSSFANYVTRENNAISGTCTCIILIHVLNTVRNFYELIHLTLKILSYFWDCLKCIIWDFIFQDGTYYMVKKVCPGDSIHSLLSVLDVLTVNFLIMLFKITFKITIKYSQFRQYLWSLLKYPWIEIVSFKIVLQGHAAPYKTVSAQAAEDSTVLK